MRELQERLQGVGQRMTRQRAAVYTALRGTRAHPTADELFLLVRADLPGISLATVYNTLEALVACGLALKLAGEGPARYDADCSLHGHARCRRCGRVADLPDASLAGMLAEIPVPAGFLPQALSINVEGICGCCGETPRG
ncbi:MAG TPA: transcriptional repressor [Armatimonadota bacterium]|jgi:Fur family peroxide stress response transcriptional regulator